MVSCGVPTELVLQCHCHLMGLRGGQSGVMGTWAACLPVEEDRWGFEGWVMARASCYRASGSRCAHLTSLVPSRALTFCCHSEKHRLLLKLLSDLGPSYLQNCALNRPLFFANHPAQAFSELAEAEEAVRSIQQSFF